MLSVGRRVGLTLISSPKQIMLDRLQNEITKNNKLKEVIEAEKQSHALSRVEAQQLQEEIKKYKRNAEELLVCYAW